MKIILFHTQDCPHYSTALAELNSVLVEEGLRPAVELIEIKNQTQAQILHFPGSPTIRINGEDIEPIGLEQQEFGVACRLYRKNGTMQGWPSAEVIRQAVRKVKDLEASQEEWNYPVGCCG